MTTRNQSWVGYTEGRRRAAVLRSLGLVGALLFATVSGGSGLSTFLVIAVPCLLVTAVVIDVLVRPRATRDGAAFLVLTPVGAVSGRALAVSNPNATVPGRLVIRAQGVDWTSQRAGHLAWRRDEVVDVALRRVASFRPLGYLTLTLTDGAAFTARVFQSRAIGDVLTAYGYPGRR